MKPPDTSSAHMFARAARSERTARTKTTHARKRRLPWTASRRSPCALLPECVQNATPFGGKAHSEIARCGASLPTEPRTFPRIRFFPFAKAETRPTLRAPVAHVKEKAMGPCAFRRCRGFSPELQSDSKTVPHRTRRTRSLLWHVEEGSRRHDRDIAVRFCRLAFTPGARGDGRRRQESGQGRRMR